MTRTNNAGLLLLLIGVLGFVGFLTGSLDRWLGYLFDPSRPSLGPTSATSPTAAPTSGAASSSSPFQLVRVGATDPLSTGAMGNAAALANVGGLVPGLTSLGSATSRQTA